VDLQHREKTRGAKVETRDGCYRTYKRSIHQTRKSATIPSTTWAIHCPAVFGFPKLNTAQSYHSDDSGDRAWLWI
jgi:hypothetical protein